MLHNNASLTRYEVEAHIVILLVTCSESVQGDRRLCFRVIVAHHTTMQDIADNECVLRA